MIYNVRLFRSILVSFLFIHVLFACSLRFFFLVFLFVCFRILTGDGAYEYMKTYQSYNVCKSSERQNHHVTINTKQKWQKYIEAMKTSNQQQQHNKQTRTRNDPPSSCDILCQQTASKKGKIDEQQQHHQQHDIYNNNNNSSNNNVNNNINNDNINNTVYDDIHHADGGNGVHMDGDNHKQENMQEKRTEDNIMDTTLNVNTSQQQFYIIALFSVSG